MEYQPVTKEITTATFDYSEVDKDTKGKLLCIAREVKQAKKQHAESGMDIGKSVSTAHALLAVDGRDGKFSQWVEAECGFSRRSAYNYMHAWQRFGNCASLAQLTQEAMYALAEPSAPEKAVKEAVKLADKGERVTLEKAKEILGRFKEVSAKSKPAQKPETPPYVDPVEAACDHDFDDEACRKCHAPKPAVKQYADTFEPATFADTPLDLVAKQAPYDDILNAITAIQKNWNAITEDERDGVYAADKKNRVNALIRELRPPIAQARPHAVCDHCKGKGCKKCQNCGWWPRSVVEGLKR